MSKDKDMKGKKPEGREDWKHDLENDVLTVQEATKISDGIHEGQIMNIVHENREGFDYIDMYIGITDDNGNEITIKTGFPAYVSQNSSLGKFLTTVGLEYEPKDKLKLSEIKEMIVGKTITFQTYTEDNFARVVNKTIKFN
jgi:hypothetical protein